MEIKFLFIFAMEEEAVVVGKLAENISRTNYNGFEILEFTYKGNKYISIISGIGKSRSAAACTLAIEKYKPKYIINIGTAGGINCAIGDIIISSSAIFHDVDLTAFNYLKNQLPNAPVKLTSPVNLIKKFDLEKNLKEIKNIILDDATVLTGDQFISNKKYVAGLHETYPDARAIEMEAASIALICNQYKIPYLLIKKISDLADENAPDKFKHKLTEFEKRIKQLMQEILAIEGI